MSKIGRSAPCPGGSGKKFKNCHGDSSLLQVKDDEAIPLSESAQQSGWLNYPLGEYVWFLHKTWSAANVDIPFWVRCSRQFGEPVLCLCCGTGRVALQLALSGFEVVGVDLNAEFLKEARRIQLQLQQSYGEILRVRFHRQDVVHLSLGRTFPLAIMPAWSFNLLLTVEDQGAFLKRLSDHLGDRGVFVFSVENATKAGNEDFKNGWLPTDDPQVVEAKNRMRRNTSPEEVKALLGAAGFEIVAVHGDVESIKGDIFTAATAAMDSEFNIVARKSAPRKARGRRPLRCKRVACACAKNHVNLLRAMSHPMADIISRIPAK